jgi:4-amino-4-deoxy-L-arabinose transferase-like glycosyltransferase
MKRFRRWFQAYFGWWPQWHLALILLGYVILVGLYSWFTPPFEGPDEPQHFAYITWLAAGKGFPPQGEEAWDTPVQQESGQSPLYYMLGSIPARLLGAVESPVDYRPNPHFVGPYPRLGPDNDNRAIHYTTDTSPLQGGWLALYVIRLLSLAFGLLLLISVYGLARQIFPQLPTLALAAALIVAVNPQVLFISSVVSNDIPGAALSALTLWLLALLLIRGQSRARAITLGLAYGLAFLTKASTVMLVVPIGAGLLWLWLSHRASLISVVKAGVQFSLGLLLVAGWWLIRSFRLYGSPLGLETHDLTPWAVTDTTVLAKFHARWYEVFRYFWISLGWGTIRPSGKLHDGILILTLVAVIGLAIAALRWWRKPRPRPDTKAVMLFILTLAILSVGFSLELWMRRVIAPYGRLMFPSLAAIAVLLATGWYVLNPKLPFIMSGLILIISILAPFLLLGPAFELPERLSAEAVEQLSPKISANFGLSPEEPIAELISAKSLVRSVRGGENVPVQLCWRPLAQSEEPLSVLVHLIGPEDSLIANRRTYPGLGHFSTTIWQPGYEFCDVVQVHVWEDMPETLVYKIEVALIDIKTNERLSMFDASGNPLPVLFVNDVRLIALEPQDSYVPNSGDNRPFQLTGSDLDTTWHPGEVSDFTLRWGVGEPVNEDYQLFVHLRDPDTTETIAQADGPPLDGWYPTSWWPAGETIVDRRTFLLPEDAPAGSYDLVVGFYNIASGERFGNEFLLGTVEVTP